MMKFATIAQACEALRQGKMIVVVDDPDRENEGDLVMAGEALTEEAMAFIIRHTGGVVCLALSKQIADQLELPPMVERNTARRGTAFTVSIEAAEGVTTGISAADRAATVRAAMNPVARPEDLRRPGHVFPLRAMEGGVLRRAGHTEAAVDLCRLAGVREGAVISELMCDDGVMMRVPDIERFSRQHELRVISIADLIAHRRRTETLVRREAEAALQTEYGVCRSVVFTDAVTNSEHMALVFGEIDPLKPALVRVHSECLTGDVFHSLRCDCGLQLDAALQRIAAEGGVLLYLRQEGRGAGLANKIRAYKVQQEQSLDTVEANIALGLPVDLRDYGIGAQILRDLNVGHVRLLTNNPKKIAGLDGFGLHIAEQVPLHVALASDEQRNYLRAKREKLGHTTGAA